LSDRGHRFADLRMALLRRHEAVETVESLDNLINKPASRSSTT
jgi:hypothetical protein